MTLHDLPACLSADELKLRPETESDLPEVVRQLSHECVAPWLAAVASPFGSDEAQELLNHAYHPGEHVRLIETGGALAGCICLGASLWYWLHPSFQGRGLMRSALNLALGAYFARPLPPLTATCRTDNTASIRLLTRLGFARHPGTRRMFFQAAGRSKLCQDFLMAPEQWHLLNPPRFSLGALSLRPARQRDVPTLALMRTGCREAWANPDALPEFVERHRYRGGNTGLFVAEDDDCRSIGMVLLGDATEPALYFLSEEEADLHRSIVESALVNGLPAPDSAI